MSIYSLVCLFNLPTNGHLVGRESASFVGANDRRATQSLDGRQGSYDGVLLGHTSGSESQTGRDYSWQTFRNSSYGKSNGDLEVINGAFDPGSTVCRIVEVADIDGPYGDADHGDDLRQLFTKLVQFLLQWRLDLFGLRHLCTDLTDGRVQAGPNNNTAGLSSGDIGTREQDVFLILIDSAWVRYRIGVLDHGYRFTGQDGLVNPKGSREDLGETNVGRNLVADRYLHDVTRHDLLSPDPLDAGLVSSHDFTHLGFVFFERLDRRFGISFLPDADHGIGDEDEQNNEGFDEGRECILVLFK